MVAVDKCFDKCYFERRKRERIVPGDGIGSLELELVIYAKIKRKYLYFQVGKNSFLKGPYYIYESKYNSSL